MFTPEKCRAARGALKISQEDLAVSAHVSTTTLRNFESGKPVMVPTLSAIEKALELAGARWEGDRLITKEGSL